MSQIMIVGSTHEAESGWEREDFAQYCEELGKNLSGRGHEIVVCSDSPGTADFHVVFGAEASGQKSAVSYFVSRSEEDTLASRSDPSNFSYFTNVETSTRSTAKGWFATYREAVEYADGLIAIGGSWRGTGTASYMARTLGTPVLPVPNPSIDDQKSPSTALWEEFRDDHLFDQLNDLVLPLRQEDWESKAEATVSAIEQLIRRNSFRRHSASWNLLWILQPFFVATLILCWYALTKQELPDAGWVPYLASGIAALVGMTLRYSTDDALTRVTYTAISRLSRDVTTVLCLLLGAWVIVDFSSLTTQSGTIESADLKTALFSAIGFGAGFVVETATGSLRVAFSNVISRTLEVRG